MKMTANKPQGFTIIELLIATAVFSVVLLIFLSAFLKISQLFYKGVNMTNTQENARNIVQTIADDIQFYQVTPQVYKDLNYFCIGDHVYYYEPGVQYTPGNNSYGLQRVESVCVPASGRVVFVTGSPNIQNMLDPGMQVNKLDIDCQNSICTISLKLVYYGSDKTVFVSNNSAYNSDPTSSGYNADQAPDASCTGAPNSTQYCATASYNSTVLQRF
jgi:prepilin-type N-terminal cleavage/methylation domain-containing protein